MRIGARATLAEHAVAARVSRCEQGTTHVARAAAVSVIATGLHAAGALAGGAGRLPRLFAQAVIPVSDAVAAANELGRLLEAVGNARAGRGRTARLLAAPANWT